MSAATHRKKESCSCARVKHTRNVRVHHSNWLLLFFCLRYIFICFIVIVGRPQNDKLCLSGAKKLLALRRYIYSYTYISLSFFSYFWLHFCFARCLRSCANVNWFWLYIQMCLKLVPFFWWSENMSKLQENHSFRKIQTSLT